MEAAIALAVFIGLPVAIWLLARLARRPRHSPVQVGQRLAEVEQVTVYQDARLTQVEQRLAALEQQDQAPLYGARGFVGRVQ